MSVSRVVSAVRSELHPLFRGSEPTLACSVQDRWCSSVTAREQSQAQTTARADWPIEAHTHAAETRQVPSRKRQALPAADGGPLFCAPMQAPKRNRENNWLGRFQRD